MDIVIIGSGNVATVLGRKFKAAKHTILQVYSRNASAASQLAYELETESTNYKSMINKSADVYIVAVSDNAIEDATNDLKFPGKVVAHTAASVPKEILKDVTSHYGVFYPLQSFRKEMKEVPDFPVFFDGSDGEASKLLEKLAHSIAAENVTQASNDERLKLHVAAVFVSNFVNHLYALTEVYCRKENIDFKQLWPLIAETASRIQEVSPKNSQTGPALRNDSETIHKHLELLKDHPQLKTIYVLMTESIQQMK